MIATDTTRVMEGTHAASHAVRLARVQVIAAYPITPQTSVVEKLSEMCASGEIGARFIHVESEHSSMAACVGAAAAGARAFTATSSQGLALMHEMLHWAAGGRLPVVMVNVNRALAAPWSIYCEQNDSLSQRDTGWMQIYCESNQEVLDSVLHAYRVAERVLVPCMVNLDAFFLSHTSEPVAVPTQERVDEFLPAFRPPYTLDPAAPHAFGGLVRPDLYTELRYNLDRAHHEAKALFEEADEVWERLVGRRCGGLVEAYRCEDAEIALLTCGTAASTARIVVDEYRDRGIPLGLLRLRVFRPFPAERLLELVQPLKKVAVLDRNVSYGTGGVIWQELKAVLASAPQRPVLLGAIGGLGGRDLTPAVISRVVERMRATDETLPRPVWIDLKAPPDNGATTPAGGQST